jgi:N-acetylglucosamine kinase-like BadF-type ATPase
VTEQKRFVIGVDGGGTKTSAILVGLDGTVLAEAAGGPTNLATVGAVKASQVLLDLILECCEKAQAEPSMMQNLVLGLAGAGRPAARTDLSDKLIALGTKRKIQLKNIVVETDARIALEAAFAGGPGIAVIAGTGSIALYHTEDGKYLRAGGWGHLVGDEGSGYAIGRDGLTAALRQFDGRGEKTLLAKKALQHYGVAALDDLIPKLYQDHADIASFAPFVFEAAVERDRLAHLILVKNAGDLAEHVRVLTMESRPKHKLPVCLMGGLLAAENVYSKLVKEKITGSLPQVLILKPKFPAAFGAAILGLNAFR